MAKIDQEKESTALTGALIGGIIGIGALTIFLALRGEKEEPLNTLGKTIARVGDILEENSIEEPRSVKNLGKQLQKSENTILEVVDWVATGINLWKNFKK